MAWTQLTITEQDILDHLSTLDVNKAYGSDENPARLLKEAAREITPSLSVSQYLQIAFSQKIK